MTPFAFASRTRNAVAVAMSAVAAMAIVSYLTAPVAAKPAIVAKSLRARHPMIVGMVKGDPRHAHVTLTFHDAGGDVLAVRHPHVARSGAWKASIPRHAQKVTVVVHDDGRTAEAEEPIVAGRSLHLTAVFGDGRTGLVPGLFPY